MKSIIALVVGTILFFAGTLAFKLGVYKSAHVTELNEGPFHQVYKRHVGPYYKIVPTIEAVEDWAEENKMKCALTFGEYLDDPKVVAEDRLQSYGGCIVDRPIDPASLPEEFFYREVPARHYVVATFDGAPSIGPYKAYPKAFDYIQEKGKKLSGPVTEIYRLTGDKGVETKYLFPVE